jgi:Transmembrane domain of unknown function (DUF3566)
MANVADDLDTGDEPTPPSTKAKRPAPGVPARAPQPRPPAPAPRPVPQEPPERSYRQTVKRVDLWSVLKMSVCFYLCAMVVLVVALIVLWGIADAAGVISSVESFLGDLLQTKDFTFLDGAILRGMLLVAAVLVVLMIVVTVIGAAFYNLFAELFGGVELVITEDESGY